MTRATDAIRAAVREVERHFPTLDAWAVVQDAAAQCRADGFALADSLGDYAAELAADAAQLLSEGDRWGESDPDYADDFADVYDWREC